MRAGYKVINDLFEKVIFIIVSNYPDVNEVCNWGCESKQEFNTLKHKSDIGFWRIKRK